MTPADYLLIAGTLMFLVGCVIVWNETR